METSRRDKKDNLRLRDFGFNNECWLSCTPVSETFPDSNHTLTLLRESQLHPATFSKPTATDSLNLLTTGSHIPASNLSCFLPIKDLLTSFFFFFLNRTSIPSSTGNSFFSYKILYSCFILLKYSGSHSMGWKPLRLPETLHRVCEGFPLLTPSLVKARFSP